MSDDLKIRKRWAQVYREAAELVLTREYHFSWAIVKASTIEDTGMLGDLFAEFFDPMNKTQVWWELWEIEERVQALLLMAEMVERGDA